MIKLFFDTNNKGMFGGLQSQVSNQIVKQLDSGKSFYVEIGELKKDKTYQQLKGFYEALNQLMPQYNQERKDEGEIEFTQEEFKFILKYIGGWYKEIKNKKGVAMPISKSFSNITKEEMMAVLKRIEGWAVQKGFSLDITKNEDN